MGEYLSEVITVIVALFAGCWAVVQALGRKFDECEVRRNAANEKLQEQIETLKRESATKSEVYALISELRTSMESSQTRIDTKLSSIISLILRVNLYDKEKTIEYEKAFGSMNKTQPGGRTDE